MNNKKRVFSVCLLSIMGFIFCFSAFALDSLSSILPNITDSQMDALYLGEIVETSTLDEVDITAVMPEKSVLKSVGHTAQNATTGFSENLTVLLPYPTAWGGLTQEEKQLELLNLMRTVSTQEGITYISHRAGDKPKVLFEKSWYLSDPNNWKSKIDDPVVDELPSYIESYCYQKDSTFGGNIYRHIFTIDDSEIFLEVTNVTALKFLGFTCLKAEQLNMYLDTYLTEDGILLNAMATVTDREPQVKVLFITVDLPSAFLRRVTALKNWMADRLLSVDASADANN